LVLHKSDRGIVKEASHWQVEFLILVIGDIVLDCPWRDEILVPWRDEYLGFKEDIAGVFKCSVVVGIEVGIILGVA
jgi:hypothetical protein